MRGNNQDWSSYFPTQPQEIERIIPVPDETILIVYFIDVAIFPDYPQFDRLKFPMLNIPEEALADSMIGFKSLSAIEEFLAEPDLAKYKISSCSCNCGCK
jgi:hypothetical protein